MKSFSYLFTAALLLNTSPLIAMDWNDPDAFRRHGWALSTPQQPANQINAWRAPLINPNANFLQPDYLDTLLQEHDKKMAESKKKLDEDMERLERKNQALMAEMDARLEKYSSPSFLQRNAAAIFNPAPTFPQWNPAPTSFPQWNPAPQANIKPAEEGLPDCLQGLIAGFNDNPPQLDLTRAQLEEQYNNGQVNGRFLDELAAPLAYSGLQQAREERLREAQQAREQRLRAAQQAREERQKAPQVSQRPVFQQPQAAPMGMQYVFNQPFFQQPQAAPMGQPMILQPFAAPMGQPMFVQPFAAPMGKPVITQAQAAPLPQVQDQRLDSPQLKKRMIPIVDEKNIVVLTAPELTIDDYMNFICLNENPFDNEEWEMDVSNHNAFGVIIAGKIKEYVFDNPKLDTANGKKIVCYYLKNIKTSTLLDEPLRFIRKEKEHLPASSAVMKAAEQKAPQAVAVEGPKSQAPDSLAAALKSRVNVTPEEIAKRLTALEKLNQPKDVRQNDEPKIAVKLRSALERNLPENKVPEPQVNPKPFGESLRTAEKSVVKPVENNQVPESPFGPRVLRKVVEQKTEVKPAEPAAQPQPAEPVAQPVVPAAQPNPAGALAQAQLVVPAAQANGHQNAVNGQQIRPLPVPRPLPKPPGQK